MSKKKTGKETRTIQMAIDRLLEEMEKTAPHTNEYAKMVEQVDKLRKAQTYTSEVDWNKNVIFTSVLALVGNLAGIAAVINHEQVGVLTSKALGFIIKPKI